MPLNPPSYDPLAADTSVGPSPALFGSFNIDQIRRDPTKGYFDRIMADEMPYIDASGGAIVTGFGRLQGYAYTGATIAQPTGGTLGGEAAFASDGDNEGVAISKKIAACFISNSHGRLAAEWRMRTSTIADTKHGIFAGLLEAGVVAAGVPLATDGTLADKNFIGFHRLEGDGDYLDVVYKADGQTQQSPITDAIALVAATWVKVGFLFDPRADTAQRIKFFKNGVPLSTYVTGTNIDAATFPDDVALALCFATMNATASTPGNSSFSWMQVVQEFY